MTLPRAFLKAPYAHRGLHDVKNGRPENSRAAIRAAIEHGYGIEIDLQLSADGVAMVFHDDVLDRLTKATGPVRARTRAELEAIRLTGGDESIPTLAETLEIAAGRVPMLIELKDQDGMMGPNVGALETATANTLRSYIGPVAVMSFNPHSVAAMATRVPDLPRGIVTSAFRPDEWPLPEETCARLREVPDYARTGSCFISHEVDDLGRARVAELKAQGASICCWTVRSIDEEREARKIADNITFEGYLAPHPA